MPDTPEIRAQIAALKEQRGDAWRAALPDRDTLKAMSTAEQQLASVRALYDPAVRAIEDQIDALRREQWDDPPGLETMAESRRRAAATIIPPDRWAEVKALVDADGTGG